jgi:thiol:disulfide interchange protein
MKLIVLILVLISSLVASGIKFEHNFKKALQMAKAQNKEVMMMYSAVWCPECNYMKNIVFKDKKVNAYIQKHFIVLSKDIEKDKLPSGFKYVGIPTFFFIDKSAKEKDRIVGGDRADKFFKKLKALK